MTNDPEDQPLTPEQEKRIAQLRTFFKEMGPVIGELYRASFLDDGTFDESEARQAAHKNEQGN